MSWYWWVLLLIVMYGLGLAGAKYFEKTHPPDRRVGDRRSGRDRRADARAAAAAAQRLDAAGEAPRRRESDRGAVPPPPPAKRRLRARHAMVDAPGNGRRRSDRRQPKPLWQLSVVIASGALLSIIGVVAYGESQVESIFMTTMPELTGSGWADCDVPITWSLDTSRLTPAEAAVASDQMTSDFAKWGAASGLTFQYVGEVPVIYNDTTFIVTSDQHPSDRHVYVAFLHDSESSMLDDARSALRRRRKSSRTHGRSPKAVSSSRWNTSRRSTRPTRAASTCTNSAMPSASDTARTRPP